MAKKKSKKAPVDSSMPPKGMKKKKGC